MDVHYRQLKKTQIRKKDQAPSWDPVLLYTKSYYKEGEQTEKTIWTKVATNFFSLERLGKVTGLYLPPF